MRMDRVVSPGGGYDVVVVGAGASGMLAAGRAAQLGARVLLVEQKPKVGLKIRITGRGRCNITNTKPYELFMAGVHGDVTLAETALRAFTHGDIVDLLHGVGVPTQVERGDRVYPVSGQAADVAEALGTWCAQQGCDLWLETKVVELRAGEDGWQLGMERANGATEQVQVRGVILACGGKSYPNTGSDGSGYELASQAGLAVTPLRQGLVGFDTLPRLMRDTRLALRNVRLRAFCQGQELGAEEGEMELTPNGIGGPIVLRLSRRIMTVLEEGGLPTVSLDLKPALSSEQLMARIQRDVEARGSESIYSVARAWVPAELVEPLIRFAGLSGSVLASRVPGAGLTKIVDTLKSIRLRVVAPEGWNRAVITLGGIAASELDASTLATRNAPGLFVCGEMLDVDGDSGGYNLQLAYSTGWLAGTHAAAYAKGTQGGE